MTEVRELTSEEFTELATWNRVVAKAVSEKGWRSNKPLWLARIQCQHNNWLVIGNLVDYVPHPHSAGEQAMILRGERYLCLQCMRIKEVTT